MGATCAGWALCGDWDPLRCRPLLLCDPCQMGAHIPARITAHTQGRGTRHLHGGRHPPTLTGWSLLPGRGSCGVGRHLVCMGTAVVTLGGKSEWVDGDAHVTYWPGNPPHTCRPVAAPRGPCASPGELSLLRGPAAGPPRGKWAGRAGPPRAGPSLVSEARHPERRSRVGHCAWVRVVGHGVAGMWEEVYSCSAFCASPQPRGQKDPVEGTGRPAVTTAF